MIIVKILLQLLISISAFLAIYLDYKWTDKRRKKFKRTRNWLVIIMGVILIVSVGLTIHDDKEQKNERLELNKELSDLKDSLSIIKKIGVDLNTQIEPLIKIAREKYPDLPIEEALKKLELDIDSLELKTSTLEEINRKNKIEKEKLEELKRTPPNVEFSLEIENNKLYVIIDFKNEVPIKMRPYLSVIWDNEMNEMKGTGWRVYTDYSDIYPSAGLSKVRFEYDDISNKGLPLGEKILGFRMIIRYFSIYYPEIKDEKLGEKTVELNLALDPRDNKFKDIIN